MNRRSDTAAVPHWTAMFPRGSLPAALLVAVALTATACVDVADDADLGTSNFAVLEQTADSFTVTGTVGQAEEHTFLVPLPPDATDIRVKLSGTNDADLYTEDSAEPTVNEFDCRPYIDGTEEDCAYGATMGDLGVMIRGFSVNPSQYTLKVRWEGISTSP